MDTELVLMQFEEIEQKVGQLIENCNSLKITNSELSDRVEYLEKELQEKIEIENRYVKERELVSSKIDGLLNRLEQKEDAQD
ncbi:MAG: cell division protein ZapB [Deltaproteobacteria bacterium]|nr:cell division protein ZapB [Deltaproteobacteria bacterium]